MEIANGASPSNEAVKDDSSHGAATPRSVTSSLPVEEMFGSVTTFNTSDGIDQNTGKTCQQLRTSARVIKKLKLDSSLGGNSVEKEKNKDTIKDDEKTEIKTRVNRPKVVWSPEDKNHFFDAIKEYGKDFDAIQDYITSKYKKKGVLESQIKTKVQIRHFYYRTWHKVSKYLKFSDEVKKVVQEYYALINYGELRRKVGVTSEKTCVKLNELMYRGATQIRIRGKTVRIKTPMCRTLRRLNQIDERSEDLKLPTKILVELRPRDMEAWTHVQAMAQNPRVQCTMGLQKRLHMLISYLNSRWRTYEQRAYDKTLNSQQSNSNTGETSSLEEEKKFVVEPVLRVAPKSGTIIQMPQINYSEFLTNCRISLNAYEERMGIKNRGEPIWLASMNNSKNVNKIQPTRRGTKRQRNDSSGEKSCKSNLDVDINCSLESSNNDVSEIVDSVVNTILALSHDNNNDDNKDVNDSHIDSIKLEDSAIEKRILAVENVRNGWTIQDVDTISVGELYLMIGNDSKIELEYWWETPEVKTEPVKSESIKSANETMPPTEEKQANPVNVLLQKLLSLAKLYYRKEKVECPCGHVCGSTNRASTSCRSKLVPLKNIHRIEAKPNQSDGVSTIEEISLSPPVLAPRVDGVFRLPVTPLVSRSNSSALEAFKAKLDSLKPKYCQRRGRTVRSKQVVVQRTLPLLPKTGTNETSILTMKVIPQGSLASDFVPIAPKISIQQTTCVENTYIQTKPTQHSIALSPIPMDRLIDDQQVITTTTTESNNSSFQTNEQKSQYPSSDATNNQVELIAPPSPTPTISTLLELDKNDQPCSNNDILLENSNSTFTDFLNENARGIETPLSASPSRLLKEDDAQWLNSEVADFSLSSFLGHLESPLKTTASNINVEDSRMSQDPHDMDAHFNSLLTENSIDYMAKFADLAAQMASDSQKN